MKSRKQTKPCDARSADSARPLLGSADTSTTQRFPESSERESDSLGADNLRIHGAWVEVNLANIVANARSILDSASGAKLLVVVKANAYGLGAGKIARMLEPLKPWGFAVATLDEGVVLRDVGISRPVVVLRPAEPWMENSFRHHELRPVIESKGCLNDWGIPFHVEIDTGMSRTGVRWDDSAELMGIGTRRPEGVFTHFYSADESADSVRVQCERFQHALGDMDFRPPILHAANSAGIWHVPRIFDLVRPGIFLYGGCPGSGLPVPLPVVSLRARVISVRRIMRGESVSYGAEWSAERDTWIATLAIGYADGIPRGLNGSSAVLLKGRRCALAGRVTMDMMMIEVGTEDRCLPRIGEIATLIGTDGDDMITLDEFAARSGTISYEVLTRLGSRLPRVYIGESRDLLEK